MKRLHEEGKENEDPNDKGQGKNQKLTDEKCKEEKEQVKEQDWVTKADEMLVNTFFTEVKYKIPSELRTKPLFEVYENRHKLDEWLQYFLESSCVVVSPVAVNIITPADLVGITQRLDSIDAQLRNTRIRKANAMAIGMPGGVTPLTPLVKEVPGNGAALPIPGLLPFAPVPLLVGAAPGIPLFPANLNALNALTNQQISNLSVIYNDDFGIVAGDDIATRKVKLQWWVCN